MQLLSSAFYVSLGIQRGSLRNPIVFFKTSQQPWSPLKNDPRDEKCQSRPASLNVSPVLVQSRRWAVAFPYRLPLINGCKPSWCLLPYDDRYPLDHPMMVSVPPAIVSKSHRELLSKLPVRALKQPRFPLTDCLSKFNNRCKTTC